MQRKINNVLQLLVILFISISNVSANDIEKQIQEKSFKENISIISAMAKPSLSGRNNSAAYISLKNDNESDVVIVGSLATSGPKENASSIANRVEMHIIVTDEKGMAKMVPVNRLVIPAKSELIMKPGGIHIMLLDLKKPLQNGDKFYVSFVMEDVGLYQAEVLVGNM